jgi:hypothetical protein
MKKWFTCKVKYGKQLEEGGMKQVTEAYLVDAVSYTEAESRIYAAMEEYISGEFQISAIAKSNIDDVINHEDSDYWYKCKVNYSTVDGDNEKEVKVSTYFLVSAGDPKQAIERLEDNLNSMLVPFEIPSITKTTLVDVFPYFSDEVPANFTPINEVKKDGEHKLEESSQSENLVKNEEIEEAEQV